MLFCKHYKQPTERDKSLVKIMCILRDLHVTIPEQYKKLKKKPNAAKILNLKKNINFKLLSLTDLKKFNTYKSYWF